MVTIIKRKYKGGKLVNESKEEVPWKPNEADLDLVTIKCDCGSSFEMPFDAAMMGLDGCYCGQCGSNGNMKIIDRGENNVI